jgi:hypothetical protein
MLTLAGIKRQMRRYACVGLLVTLAPLALSCYGNFPLTKAIYNMNARAGGEIGEDRTQHNLVRSVVMWVLIIVPVYEVGMFADVVVLNLIEFWTGDKVQIGSVQEQDGTQVAFQPSPDGNEAVLTVSRDGRRLVEQHLVKISATTFEMRDASGNLTGTVVRTAEGGVQLADARGQVVQTLAAEDLAALHRR